MYWEIKIYWDILQFSKIFLKMDASLRWSSINNRTDFNIWEPLREECLRNGNTWFIIYFEVRTQYSTNKYCEIHRVLWKTLVMSLFLAHKTPKIKLKYVILVKDILEVVRPT